MVNYSTGPAGTVPALTVLVCINERFHPSKPSCAGRGSREMLALLRARLDAASLPVEVRELHCFGRCELGPNVRIAPGGAFFHGVDAACVDEIVSAVQALVAAAP